MYLYAVCKYRSRETTTKCHVLSFRHPCATPTVKLHHKGLLQYYWVVVNLLYIIGTYVRACVYYTLRRCTRSKVHCITLYTRKVIIYGYDLLRIAALRIYTDRWFSAKANRNIRAVLRYT